MRIVRGSWRLVVLIIIICEILAVVFLIVTPPTYVTQAIMAPQQSNGRDVEGGSGAGLSGSLGSAAALLGIGRGQTNNDFQKFSVLLKSPRVAQGVEDRLHLMKRYFPGWSEARQKWEAPSFSLRMLVRVLFRRPAWREPDAADFSTVLNSRIKSVVDPETGFITLSLQDEDPTLSRQLLQAIIDATDQELRADAQKRAEVQIGYLADQLKVVTNSDQRTALTSLLLSQEQTLMLSRSGLPFVAQTLAPPTTHFDQPKPGISLVIAIAAVAGMVIGVFAALAREAMAHAKGQEVRPFQFPWRRTRTA